MDAKSKALCTVYCVIALGALIGTWSQNLAFFATPNSGGFAFIRASFANPAAASISIDLLCMCLTAFIWMVLEARKLGIRFVWVYILLSFMIAVSVMFPLFLLAREVRIAARKESAVS
jgi:Protein of unknown function DUF2834